MSIIYPLPVQGCLFPEDISQQKSLVGSMGDKPVTPRSFVAEEDFHDEQLPWGQEGESLL